MNHSFVARKRKKSYRITTISPGAVQRATISDLQVLELCHATFSHASSSVSNIHWSNYPLYKVTSHVSAQRAKYLGKVGYSSDLRSVGIYYKQWWNVAKCIYFITVLKYNLEVFVLDLTYFHFRQLYGLKKCPPS